MQMFLFDQQLALVSASIERIAADQDWADSPETLVDRAAESVEWYDADFSTAPSWF